MTITRLTLILCSTACASLAFAQPQAPQSHGEMPHFDVVDTDKDGFLGIDEAHAAFAGLHIEDTDGDGLVAKGEAEAAMPGLRYTNDTHEDFEHRIGPADYVLMAEQFMQGHIQEETDH